MDTGKTGQTSGSLLVLLVAIVLCVLSCLFMMDYIPDDSYISFRYAENLANGHGLRFNTSESPVEAYSNLLWILLCALLFKLGMDLPTVVPYAGILIGILNVYFLWILFKRRGIPALQMLLPLLILASSGPFIAYTISGMETPLFALLMLVAMVWLDLVFSTGKAIYYVFLTLTGVLLSLCRPEGMIAFPIIAVAMYWASQDTDEAGPFGKTRMKGLVFTLAAFTIAMLLYRIWKVSYFGDWLPTPYLSKGGAGKAFWYAWPQNFYFYFIKQLYYFPPMGYYYTALIFLSIVGLKISESKKPHRRTEFVATFFVLAYVLVYFNFRDWMPGMRYHAAFVGLTLFPAVHILAPFFGKIRTGREKRAFWVIAAAVLIVNFSAMAQLRIVTKRMEIGNEECLVALGKWLKENMPRGSVLAVSDVGAIPYYSGFETIDTHPESLTDRFIAENGFSIDYVYKRKPDIFVITSRSIYVTKFYPEHFEMVNDPRAQDYRFLGVSRYDWYEDRCYWVFIPASHPELTETQVQSFPIGLGSVRRVIAK